MEYIAFNHTAIHPMLQIEPNTVVQEHVIAHSYMITGKHVELYAPVIVVYKIILNCEIIAFEINPESAVGDIVLPDDIPWRYTLTIFN